MTVEKMIITLCKSNKKYCHKRIGIGNTFCWSIVISIDNSFHKYCQHPCLWLLLWLIKMWYRSKWCLKLH